MICYQKKTSFHFPWLHTGKTERQSHHSILQRHLEDLYLSHSQLETALQCRNKISTLLERENLKQFQCNRVDRYCCLVNESFNSLLVSTLKGWMDPEQVWTTKDKVNCSSSLYSFKFCISNNSEVTFRLQIWVLHKFSNQVKPTHQAPMMLIQE